MTRARRHCLTVPLLTVSVPDAEHFKEIGHVLESATAGTDVLVLVSLHFN